MRAFEYSVVTTPRGEHHLSRLNELGLKGWQVVSVEHDRVGHVYILMREVWLDDVHRNEDGTRCYACQHIGRNRCPDHHDCPIKEIA